MSSALSVAESLGECGNVVDTTLSSGPFRVVWSKRRGMRSFVGVASIGRGSADKMQLGTYELGERELGLCDRKGA